MRTDGNGLKGGAGSSDSPAGESDCGVMLDELNSAAAPFLYLLATVMIAASGYLLYAALHG